MRGLECMPSGEGSGLWKKLRSRLSWEEPALGHHRPDMEPKKALEEGKRSCERHESRVRGEIIEDIHKSSRRREKSTRGEGVTA